MKFPAIAAVLGVLAVMTTGCAMRTAVISNENNAFVVKATPFGSSMWACKAEGGKPVCTKVTEE